MRFVTRVQARTDAQRFCVLRLTIIVIPQAASQV
jgi:hypothetical protein